MNKGSLDAFGTDNTNPIFQPAVALLADSTGSILSSYNVKSVVRNGAGDITVTTYAPFKNTNFITLATAYYAGGAAFTVTVSVKSTTSVRLLATIFQGGGIVASDPDGWNLICFDKF